MLSPAREEIHQARASKAVSIFLRLSIALGFLIICKPSLASKITICLLNPANSCLLLSSTTTSVEHMILTSSAKSVESRLLGSAKLVSFNTSSVEIPWTMTSSSTELGTMTSSLLLPNVNTLKTAVNTLMTVAWSWWGMQLSAVFKPETAFVTAQGTNTARAADLWILSLILPFSTSKMRRHRTSFIADLAQVVTVTEYSRNLSSASKLQIDIVLLKNIRILDTTSLLQVVPGASSPSSPAKFEGASFFSFRWKAKAYLSKIGLLK